MPSETTTHRQSFPYYPLLLALYPVAALLATNLGQVRLLAGLRPALFSLAGGALLYGLLRLILKDWARAALLAGLALLLFFSYGHVYGLLEPVKVGGMQIGRHRWLGPLWLLLFGAGAWWVLRRKNISPVWARVLNLASLVMLLLAVGQLTYGQARGMLRTSVTGVHAALDSAGSTHSTGPAGSLPDIYYIILDGYTRADGLKQDYGFDNSLFMTQLHELGFTIPPCTQSNYAFTALSLSSTLHMDYLENFSDLIQSGDSARDWVAYRDFIAHNPVRQNLQKLGYKTVAFETGFWWADVTDADVYIVGNNNPVAKLALDHDINDFEDMFVRTTALRVFTEGNTSLRARLAPQIRTVEQRRFDTVNFVFDQLKTVPRIAGPKFVYVHIVAPHPPYVFDEKGNFRVLQRDTEGYVPEVEYLNGRVIQAVKEILAGSKTPPVIVIQGDHGWSEQNRMKILNAYYLPDGGGKAVYDTITPVNTFRVIFNTYFGGQYNQIEDKSLYSTEDKVYQFTLRPSTCMDR